jgi:adenosylhomocysteine nucleosidase
MIGIIGAMDQELKDFITLVQDKKIVKHNEFEFILGKVKDSEVVLVKTRVGKVAAAVATTMLLNYFIVDYVINIGSAGGAKKSSKTGDVIVGNRIFYGDVDLTAFDYKYGQMSGCPYYFKGDDMLIDKFIKVNNEQIIFKGDILSSDKFVTNKDELSTIIFNHFNDADIYAVEMEAAAIAHTCYLFNTPFLMIKGISDIVGSTNQQFDFYKYLEIISDKLAKLLYNLL